MHGKRRPVGRRMAGEMLQRDYELQGGRAGFLRSVRKAGEGGETAGRRGGIVLPGQMTVDDFL